MEGEDFAFGIVVGVMLLVVAGVSLLVCLAPKPKPPEPTAYCCIAYGACAPCRWYRKQQDI